MTEIGDIKMSYTITPEDPPSRSWSISHNWVDASTPERAREVAESMLRNEEYRRMGLTHVTVYGREMRFAGHAWVPIRGGRTESYTLRPEDAGVTRWLTAARRCYDTTVMDYFETVHAMRSDGTCQCGDPARNVRR